MNEKELYALKFSIGEFVKPDIITPELMSIWIEEIKRFPETLEVIVSKLIVAELNYKYRPGGSTIKQGVHHCADSHMNSFICFKLALTEDNSTIRPYFEDRFAELPDSLDDDIESSLILLKGLHAKLSSVMVSLSKEDLKKEYMHLEHGEKFGLDEVVSIYAWHSKHHFAHVQQALKVNGEFT
tara:strand:- start:21157 stop:21705 length:549 start_codon:yes stop_codon:yes gene_type:complete